MRTGKVLVILTTIFLTTCIVIYYPKLLTTKERIDTFQGQRIDQRIDTFRGNRENTVTPSVNQSLLPQHVTLSEDKSKADENSKYKPIRDIFYSKIASNDDRTVLVVPRRAYFDTRKMHGKQLNWVQVIAEVEDNAVKAVLACEINGSYSQSVKLIKENNYWVRSRKKGYTHSLVIYQCIGLPKDRIINGSVVNLIYRTLGDDFYSRVETENPLIVKTHEDMSVLSRGNGSIVVCSAMYGHPSSFDEWLKYQKTLGVDMVHLSVDASFYENATLIYPFLKESCENGFVKMDVWNNIVGAKRMYYLGQMVKFQDCAYQNMGVFEYGLFYDYDDYFIPLLPDHKDIHYYFEKNFASKNTGTYSIPWKQMHCNFDGENTKSLPDGNVTKILSGYESKWRPEKKCAHRLNAVQMVMVHMIQSHLSGYKVKLGNKRLAYVAHVRHNTKMC